MSVDLETENVVSGLQRRRVLQNEACISKTDDFSGMRQTSESPEVHTKRMTGVSESSQQPRKFIGEGYGKAVTKAIDINTVNGQAPNKSIIKTVIKQSQTGVLITNLGTPQAPDFWSVARYLREFLSDGRVITIPAVFRWLLLNCIIIPSRTHKATLAYRSIWRSDGSPLLVYSQRYCAKLATRLGANYKVALGMRYGVPSIQQAVKQLLDAGCRKIILLPMFPQYARATSGSVISKVLNLLAQEQDQIPLEVKAPFFNHPEYIDALAATVTEELQTSNAEYLLLSYHGLPESQVGCSKLDACYAEGSNCANAQGDNAVVKNNACYRAQCYTTASLLAMRLGLASNQYGVSFQSRLGALPWIKPYTDEFLATLIEQGITNLAVACPSFVVDCLETLEEVGIKLKQQWKDLGGDSLQLIPCLNDQDVWVNAVVKMLQK